MVRTDQFLEVCFSQYGVIQTDVIVIRYVIENFKSYRPLLVSSLHLKYKKIVDRSIQHFSINIDNESVCRIHKTINFAYQILRSTLGLALLAYSPPNKSTRRMVYRVGTDLEKFFFILHNKSKIDKLEESNQALKTKIDHMLSEQDSSLKTCISLEDSLKMLKRHVKFYVSESIKSTNSQSPDIMTDLQIEISKIHPVLWTFIFRMTASEDEENMLKKDTFHLEDHC